MTKSMKTKTRPTWRAADEGRPFHGVGPREWFAITLYQLCLVRAFASPEEFEEATGVSAARLRAMIAAEIDPTQDELVKLRTGLNVSLDFLIAGLGIPVADGPVPEVPPLVSTCALREDRVAAIERGEAEPTLEEMVATRGVLDCTLDYLVAGVGKDPMGAPAETATTA